MPFDEMRITVEMSDEEFEFRQRLKSFGIPALMVSLLVDRLQAAVNDFVAQEREECAKECEKECDNWDDEGPLRICAKAIRARGNK